jgi:hypothetical protein
MPVSGSQGFSQSLSTAYAAAIPLPAALQLMPRRKPDSGGASMKNDDAETREFQNEHGWVKFL